MLNANCIDPWAFSQDKQTAVWQFVLNDLDPRVMEDGIFANSQNIIQAAFLGGINALGQHFIDVHLTATLQLVCQRCLKTMDFALDNTVKTLIFTDETQANQADCTVEDADVLVVGNSICVAEWVEDQLLTALPFSPMHAQCDTAVVLDNQTVNPFSVLKGLHR